MKLAIDLGNTRNKAAVFSEFQLLFHLYFTSAHQLQTALENNVELQSINQVLISSVKSDELTQVLPPQLESLPRFVLSHEAKLPFKSKYTSMHTLGLDRIANIAAACAHFPNENALIIDLGSCITYEVVSNNTFLGGRISPGLHMRLKAMNAFTGKLPLVSINEAQKPHPVGLNTSENLQSGAFYGICDEINGFITEVERQFTSLNIVFTGGDAPLFAEEIKKVTFADPFFTLRGINYLVHAQ